MTRLHLGHRREPITAEPDIVEPLKRAIRSAVRWAWEEIRRRWPDVRDTAYEEQITERLWRVLNEQDADSRRIATWLADFETVIRGGKVTSANGTIERQPDLVFRPIVAAGVRNKSDWGLFVECKIIAKNANHSADAYCKQGVSRFTNGHYAPRVPSGAMIGYVRDARAPYPTLSPLLDATYATIEHAEGSTPDISHSLHARSALSQPCVNIALVHLWLDARG